MNCGVQADLKPPDEGENKQEVKVVERERARAELEIGTIPAFEIEPTVIEKIHEDFTCQTDFEPEVRVEEKIVEKIIEKQVEVVKTMEEPKKEFKTLEVQTDEVKTKPALL